MNLIKYRGFSASTATYGGWGAGECLGDAWNGCEVFVDETAALYSGDYVRALEPSRDMWIIKRLECTRNGQWYLICQDSVIPLSVYAFQPTAIQKIVARTPARATLAQGRAPNYAPMYDIVWNKVFSEEAVAEWEREGFPDGVPFPGLAALFRQPEVGEPPHWAPAGFNKKFLAALEQIGNPERYDPVPLDVQPRAPDVVVRRLNNNSQQPLAAAVTAFTMPDSTNGTVRCFGGPPVNSATKPSLPTMVTARVLNGSIVFDWTDPDVRPVGTQFRIVSNVNSDPVNGIERWRGSAQHVVMEFTQPQSASMWWVQSFVNTLNSDFSPVLQISAMFPAELTGSKIIPDGQFRSGTNVSSYWSGGNTAPLSLSGSGGMTDNTGKITCVGTTHFGGFPSWVRDVYPLRDALPGAPVAFAQVVAGQFMNWYAVARRTTTLVGSVAGTIGGAGFTVHVDVRHYAGGGPVITDVGSRFCRMDTAPLNQWQFFVGSVQIPNSLWDLAMPVLRFGDYQQYSGTLEVGRFDAYLV